MKTLKELIEKFDNLTANQQILLITGGIILFLLICGIVASTGNNSTTTNTNSKISDGVIHNVTDISVTSDEDQVDLSEYSNSSTTGYKYSTAKINFDVETNGSIYNYTATVKCYDGDKLIGTHVDSNSYSNDLNPGINHKNIELNSYNGGLPANGRLTDVVITFEANINGVNEKLFETPKVNAGNIKLYKNEVPNPYYNEPSTSSSSSSSTTLTFYAGDYAYDNLGGLYYFASKDLTEYAYMGSSKFSSYKSKMIEVPYLNDQLTEPVYFMLDESITLNVHKREQQPFDGITTYDVT